jgi:hypothetical protein
LFGKTDAALVSEANTLLAQNAGKLRIVHTTGSVPMPVVAFGPMTRDDREAAIAALRSRSGVAEIERERPAAPKKIEVASLSAAALGLAAPAEPPAKLALRVVLPIPQVAIDETMYDER